MVGGSDPHRVLDVLVVGAGPAGTAAAITARRQGLDVAVVDKAHFPRDKTCGDGLTAGALRALEALGLDVRILPSHAPVTEAVLIAPSGRRVSLPLPLDSAHASVVRRFELDAALVERARDEGVAVYEGCGVVDTRDTADEVHVALVDGRTVRARWVIAADGHYSTMRRLLARARGSSADVERLHDPPTADLGTWHAFRQYFDGVAERRLVVVFDAELLPGYAWVFPVGDGRANVGFGVLRNRRHANDAPSGKWLAALWRDVLARPAMREVLGTASVPEGTHRAWPIPASFDPARLVSGRVLFTGDAAGVVDPMTGEGIAQALDTGALAARAVSLEATRDAVGARYRRDVGRALAADLRFASALQHLLRTRSGTELAIGAAGLTPWTRRNFARWMFEDYPRAAVLTPRRWHRGAFTPAGAYAASDA